MKQLVMLFGALITASFSAYGEPVFLVCVAYPGGNKTSITFKIDEAKSTVDDLRASFSNAKIFWTDTVMDRGVPLKRMHTLDRYAGTYSIETDSKAYFAGPPTVFSCTSSKSRQF